MSRAPFVMGKASAPYQRQAELFDTTIGWRFVNPLMRNTSELTACRKRQRM
jgi:3-oxo-5,6-didehydrosuberyl-CoA/3-oxoadipyl-CoA thiolase